MGANLNAIRAVNEAAFRDVEWTPQEAAVVAVNGAPVDATDGVSTDGRSAFAFQVVDTLGDADLILDVWGYANGAWCKIPDGQYTIGVGGLIECTPLGGACERIYLEVSTYTAGTVDLNIGVPKP